MICCCAMSGTAACETCKNRPAGYSASKDTVFYTPLDWSLYTPENWVFKQLEKEKKSDWEIPSFMNKPKKETITFYAMDRAVFTFEK